MYNKQNFKPFNRYIQVVPVTEREKDQPTVLVPNDYKIEPKHKVLRVVSCSKACTATFNPGEHIIVEASMIEEVSLNEGSYYLVLENYVLATLGDPTNET